MSSGDTMLSQAEAEASIAKQSTEVMTTSNNGERASAHSPRDEKLKGPSARFSSRIIAFPKSLMNLKADLITPSASKSPQISSFDKNKEQDPIPIIKKRTSHLRTPLQINDRLQLPARQFSSNQHHHQQEDDNEVRRHSSEPLHRTQKQQRSISPSTRSKSNGRDEKEQLNSAEDINSLSSDQSNLPPLWTEGFAKGVTNSIKKTVDDIISRGSLVHAPKRKFRSFLSPDDILRPSSHGYSSEEEEEEYILGSGSFSKVTKVHVKGKKGFCNNKALFALKRLKGDLLPSKLTENSLRNGSIKAFMKAATELAREAFLLSRLDHPHIINILGWTDGGVSSYSVYRRHDAYFLVLELLQEETLEDRIEGWNQDDEYLRSNPCPEYRHKESSHQRKMEKLTICRQVASALSYIHSKNVVYRDLKPQNIGFARGIDNEGYDREGNIMVKLMDFGLARELPSTGVIQSYSDFHEHKSNPLLFDMTGTVGTIRYMAPEVCMNRPYGLECDIYSWSIVAHEILSQNKPFDDMTPDMYQSLVCHRGVRPPTQNMPSEHIVLLTQAWRTDPSNRLSFTRIKRQLDLFLQQEKLMWEAQELFWEMPEKRESPIFLSNSFCKENFFASDSSYQRDSRRRNKRSWYPTNINDGHQGRDLQECPIFPNVSMDHHGEYETSIEHGHSYDYHHSHNKTRRISPTYEEISPVPLSYEATRMSIPRRRPEPVTPDQRHRPPHESRPHDYCNDYNNNHYNGNDYHDYNDQGKYHYDGSQRQISPSNDHGTWADSYYY